MSCLDICTVKMEAFHEQSISLSAPKIRLQSILQAIPLLAPSNIFVWCLVELKTDSFIYKELHIQIWFNSYKLTFGVKHVNNTVQQIMWRGQQSVSPLPTHWSYVFLALTHQYISTCNIDTAAAWYMCPCNIIRRSTKFLSAFADATNQYMNGANPSKSTVLNRKSHPK